MAKLLRYFSLFLTTFLAAVFLLVTPSNADPGTAASSSSSPGLGEALVTNPLNAVLDLVGLRGSYGRPTEPPTVSDAGAGCPSDRFSTASGECPSGTQTFSTGGAAVPTGAEAVPAAQAAAPARLAFTGPSITAWLAAVASLFALLGTALVLSARPISVSRAVQ